MAEHSAERIVARFHTAPCTYCGERSYIPLTAREVGGLRAYKNRGVSIQRALPEWDADKRELLVSGTHPACWEAMFPEEDEELESLPSPRTPEG